MHANGLHYHDTNNRQLTMVSTVKEESKGFSKRQIEQAETARAFQAYRPGTQVPKTLVSRSSKAISLSMVPVFLSSPLSVMSNYVTIPPQILSPNKRVTLSDDLLFVNHVPSSTTISDHIKFTTAKHILNWKSNNLGRCSSTCKLYILCMASESSSTCSWMVNSSRWSTN